MAPVNPARRLDVGAEVSPNGVHFRVWAPTRKTVEVILEDREGEAFSLHRESPGYFAGYVELASAGSLYKYRLDEDEAYPDPISRFQPKGPHSWSEVIDPQSFPWTDDRWPGIRIEAQVVYEMHIGTWTRQGTWASAIEYLPQLAELGITVLEVMPVAEFPGQFGWGYDGVQLFAPTRLYGRPDDFRQFVDTAHSLGIGVILDVVYNHFGPDGNYLTKFYSDYFSSAHTTDWGEAINFDGKGSGPTRELFLSNVRYWIEEFHLDGFRLDATQDIHDTSEDNILKAIAREARRQAAPRDVIVIGENEPQRTQLVRDPVEGGYGMDALWNDDFHHSAMVALTGHHEAYYSDYRGTPQEFISAVKYGFLYQGQYYGWQKNQRGTPGLDMRPSASVIMIQNHDQVANSAQGLRFNALADPGCCRAMTALLLLAPGTPMLFQGQEFAASSPFLFFADHEGQLAELVRKGRLEFLSQFRSLATPEFDVADPASLSTFERCKIDHTERERNAHVWVLHKDLLQLRRQDPVFGAQRKGAVDGAVLSSEAFLLRFFGGEEGDRLLVINLGADLTLSPIPEPLLAPPEGGEWAVTWSSENPAYGGGGTPPLEPVGNWIIPGHAAFVLTPHPAA